MNRHPLRSLAATLLLCLCVSGTATDAPRWRVKAPICPDGAQLSFPVKCPPPLSGQIAG